MNARRPIGTLLAVVVCLGAVGCGGGSRGGGGTSGGGTASSPLRQGFEALVADAKRHGRPDLAARITAVFSDPSTGAAYEIPTQAMAPAIQPGDHVTAVRLADDEPRRGDVVVFTPTAAAREACEPGSTSTTPFVKRVIGLPGETVRIDAGRVTVDGRAVNVAGVPPGARSSSTQTKYVVPRSALFVLGDNRSESCDSTLWPDPFVPKENVLWLVAGVHAPVDHAHVILR